MTSSVYSEESDLDTGSQAGGHSSAMSISTASVPWYAHLLDFDDLATVDPERGEFLSALQDLVAEKQAILSRTDLSESERSALVSNLAVRVKGLCVRPEDLGIAMVYAPGSAVFSDASHALCPNGDGEFLSSSNAEEYLSATQVRLLEFQFHSAPVSFLERNKVLREVSQET